jgi:predicted RNase H-like HicB family nuclease
MAPPVQGPWPFGLSVLRKFRRTAKMKPMEALQLTAVFMKVPEGYVGFVEELPGANTQGATLDEARDSLKEAVALVLDANRTMAVLAAGSV